MVISMLTWQKQLMRLTSDDKLFVFVAQFFFKITKLIKSNLNLILFMIVFMV